jgi:hypothetical protein
MIIVDLKNIKAQTIDIKAKNNTNISKDNDKFRIEEKL